MRYIVTNFAYGYGPYLRMAELGLAINALREKRGEERFGIIVPSVYGEKQKTIMHEEFGEEMRDIVLDPELGALLKKVFYGDNTYEEALRAFVTNSSSISEEARHLLADWDIALEINRAPRLSFDVAPAYGATFGNVSEILTMARDVSPARVDRALLEQAIVLATQLERKSRIIGLSYPSTFSYREDRTPLSNEIAIPPTLRAPRTDTREMAPGLYVTITGIPGLERLYREAQALGLALYSNDPTRLPGSTKASPDVIGNKAILLPFARSGWGSVWGAQLVDKAIVVPEFDEADDPEIYFNNLCIEKLGLGIVYRGEPLQEVLEKARALTPGIRTLNERIKSQFGTLDGNTFMAEKILEDLT